MNALLPRFLKLAYRKEPISSFILLAGAVDVVIGGVGEHWSLLTFGVTTVALAIALRWWQQRSQDEPDPQPVKYLPPASSQTALPTLNTTKRRPPSY